MAQQIILTIILVGFLAWCCWLARHKLLDPFVTAGWLQRYEVAVYRRVDGRLYRLDDLEQVRTFYDDRAAREYRTRLDVDLRAAGFFVHERDGVFPLIYVHSCPPYDPPLPGVVISGV